MIQVEYLNIAEQELLDAVAFYETEKSGLGIRFLDEVDRALEQIAEMPSAWPKVSKRSRRCRLRRFPYGLVYQVAGEKAVIIAVMHLHRKPAYWKGRER